MNQDLASYYNERANEYEKVYCNPDEQDDLLTAATLFQKIFSQKTVLEIACGTGYWTAQIAKTANSIVATDVNKSVIDIARTRQTTDNVVFEVTDMHSISADRKYDGLFGGFIWSHILLQDLDLFLDRMKDLLIAGGEMVFIDSNPVEGTLHDKKNISRLDEHGNTFQTRKLENGTMHEVLKNFPTRDLLVQKLSRIASDVDYNCLKHYWIVRCRTNK